MVKPSCWAAASRGKIWGQGLPSRGNKSKGPEVGESVARSRTKSKVDVAGIMSEGARGEEAEVGGEGQLPTRPTAAEDGLEDLFRSPVALRYWSLGGNKITDSR